MTHIQTAPTRWASPPDARRLERLALGCVVALGALSFWLAPRLPMIDLPQHAGQIALWRDLLLGRSPFAGEVQVNLFTPYLVGYGLALPLSFVMSAADAMRTVLTLAFLGFVWMGRGLRRDLGGDERIDWLFLFGFFGFAWTWGFYTFLVAAPLALGAIRLAVRFDAQPSLPRGAMVLAAGVGLLFCHGLQFLFFGLAGGAIALERLIRDARSGDARAAVLAALPRFLPYVGAALAFLAFMAFATKIGPASDPSEIIFSAPLWQRPSLALSHALSANLAGLSTVLALAAAWAPIKMGLRPAPGPGLAIVLALATLLMFGPSYALGTGFVTERFALYLLPFWGLCLKPAEGRPADRRFQAVILVCAVAALALHAARVVSFSREDRSFDPVAAAVRPGDRVLGLIFDRESPAAGSPHLYLHWGAWLQAERGAFVDFNFAYFHPQVVRFRPEKMPTVLEVEGWNPKDFDWQGWRGATYDAFLLRGPERQTAEFMAKAPCPLVVAARSAEWSLLRPGPGCRN